MAWSKYNVFSLPSCDGSHWNPTVHWPKLPDVWQQRYPEKVGSEMSAKVFLVCSYDMFGYNSPFWYYHIKSPTFNLTCTICSPSKFVFFFRMSGSRNNLFMHFKSTAKDGLLLWRGDSPMRPNSDFLSMGLQDGALIFRYCVCVKHEEQYENYKNSYI